MSKRACEVCHVKSAGIAQAVSEARAVLAEKGKS
jgi:hypothetical protein